MTLYSIIYDFFSNDLGLSTSPLTAYEWTIGGASVNMADWLSHTATIVVLVVLVLVAFKFTWWLVRLVSHAFMLRR